MIMVPLPLILCMILGFLALRIVLRGPPVPVIAGLLCLLALQALINTLALHYGIEWARLAQPVTAMAVPVLAWLAWKSDGLGQPFELRDAVHGLGPSLALILRFQETFLLELLVPFSYAAYALALAVNLRQSGTDLPRARLGQGGQPRLIWAGIAVSMALSAVSDLGIAAAIAVGQAARVPMIVDLATSVLLFGTGVLALAAERMTAGEAVADQAPPSAPTEDDQALFGRLDTLMSTHNLWKDPDLTLARLGRRLHVPAKRLSAVVNLVTGDNISRYVNGYRVRAACVVLERSGSATEAMLEAGFVTKSNFNREFRRVTGAAPTEWQAARQG